MRLRSFSQRKNCSQKQKAHRRALLPHFVLFGIMGIICVKMIILLLIMSFNNVRMIAADRWIPATCGDGIVTVWEEDCDSSSGTVLTLVTPGPGCGNDCWLDTPTATLTAVPSTGLIPLNTSFTATKDSRAVYTELNYGDGTASWSNPIFPNPYTYNNVWVYQATLLVTNNYTWPVATGVIFPFMTEYQTIISVDSICGNSILEGSEECEDSNAVNNDGCSAVCQLEIPLGTLLATPDEGNSPLSTTLSATKSSRSIYTFIDYDDGTTGANPNFSQAYIYAATGTYRPTLTIRSAYSWLIASGLSLPEIQVEDTVIVYDVSCGDGVVDPAEECDDGNNTSNDWCTAQCQIEYCGDATCQSYESCSVCSSDCGECWSPPTYTDPDPPKPEPEPEPDPPEPEPEPEPEKFYWIDFRIIHGHYNNLQDYDLQWNLIWDQYAKIMVRILTDQKFEPAYAGSSWGQRYRTDLENLWITDFQDLDGLTPVTEEIMYTMIYRGLQHQGILDKNTSMPYYLKGSLKIVSRWEILDMMMKYLLPNIGEVESDDRGITWRMRISEHTYMNFRARHDLWLFDQENYKITETEIHYFLEKEDKIEEKIFPQETVKEAKKEQQISIVMTASIWDALTSFVNASEAQIESLQSSLKKRNYYDRPINWIYDIPTRKALYAYLLEQQILTVPGSEEEPSYTPPLETPQHEVAPEPIDLSSYFDQAYLTYDSDPKIKVLQSILRLEWFYDDAIDGIYGPKTSAGVFVFQKKYLDHQLLIHPLSHGHLGPSTREIINRKLIEYNLDVKSIVK